MKKILVQNFYSKPSRNEEHLLCLEKNNANPHIDKIIILTEELTDENAAVAWNLNKADLIVTGRKREKYEDIFKLTEGKIAKNNLVILANLDIFFDDTLRYLSFFPDWSDTIMALTRWEFRGPRRRSRLLQVGNSQDVWIWRNPLNKTGIKADFAMGEPGCDNRIAYELAKNYRVINPCKTIKCHHCHQFETPDYSQVEKVPPPYKTLPQTKLKNPL